LMTELLPSARATILGLNVATIAFGRGLGDLLGPYLYQWGMLVVGLAALAFDLAAVLALRSVHIASDTAG
ncbi:MAG: hypothetical protein VB089_14480, partial [Anaerolineaceae bacterium]|nr:hypothetical protein [Anaerolineaceae bacterium]